MFRISPGAVERLLSSIFLLTQDQRFWQKAFWKEISKWLDLNSGGKPTRRVRCYRRRGEDSRTAKTKRAKESKLIYEMSNFAGHPAGVGLFCTFTTSASRHSNPRLPASRACSLYDSGRVRSAQLSHHRRWKYGTWFPVALFEWHRQHQYRYWRRSTVPQQRRFQYRSRRCSVVAQHHRHTKHCPWNRHARV